MDTTTRICTRCLEEKVLTEFNYKNKARELREIYYRDCTRQQVRMHYQTNHLYYAHKAHRRKTSLLLEHRERIGNYLESHPCIDCGEADPCCLEFDHVRGKKLAEVSRLVSEGYSWEVIEQEISKCDVRCANCHRKRHRRIRRNCLLLNGLERP